MFSRWQLAKKYIHYYCTASNGKGHGVHSPFVFAFITRVLNDRRHFNAYDQVEALRRRLLANKEWLEVEDFGAGSTLSKTNRRTIARIAKYAAKSPKYSQLLFRIVHYYQPATILELGTSLGISAAYMALANPKAKVITGEGSAAVAARATRHFQELGLEHINLVPGNFDDTLSHILESQRSIDLAFIDGNHRMEPTLHYFEQILPKTTDTSVIILDDIHWSEGMEQAWQQVKDHPSVTLTIDLFFIGLVFFRQDIKVKQHFTIRF